jgi:DNA-binding NarL/FixJ family response regulator
MTKSRVYLLDDHKIIRDGIRSILEQSAEFEIAGEEGNPEKFIESVPSLHIDILVLDLSFHHTTGFQILSKVKKQRPEIKILILSMHNDPEYMQKAALLGATGYLTKDSDAKEFLEALDSVRNNRTYFKISTSPIPSPKSEILSEREHEVLIHLANGLSSKQIAATLNISSRTVEKHRLNIMKKLGTTNSAETISVAARKNLI